VKKLVEMNDDIVAAIISGGQKKSNGRKNLP
jgi:hypothetical protein